MSVQDTANDDSNELPTNPRKLAAGQRITVNFRNSQSNGNPKKTGYAWTVSGTALVEGSDGMEFIAGLIYHKGDTHIRLRYDFAADTWAIERPRNGGTEWFRWNTSGSVNILFGDLRSDYKQE